jgi:hypothetical protein
MKKNSAMKNVICCGVVLFAFVGIGQAMPGNRHDALGRLLLESDPMQGGSKGLSPEKVRTVSDWMDNPTRKTGQYRLNGLEGSPKVTPWNHQHTRHNPIRVARALSGTREIDLATLNQARIHKIADISVTKGSGVDGWVVTDKMRKESSKILDFVEKNRRLPEKLPQWVDESGPVLKQRAVPRGAGKQSIDVVTARPGTKVMSRCLRKAGPVLASGFMVYDSYTVETAFVEGKLSEQERNVSHASNVAGVGGAVYGCKAGALLGAKGGAAIGTVIAPGFGTAIGAGVGAIGGGLGGTFAGGWAAQKGVKSSLGFYSNDAERDQEMSDDQFLDIYGASELSLSFEMYREAGIF